LANKVNQEKHQKLKNKEDVLLSSITMLRYLDLAHINPEILWKISLFIRSKGVIEVSLDQQRSEVRIKKKMSNLVQDHIILSKTQSKRKLLLLSNQK
jgi:hypothetical protein